MQEGNDNLSLNDLPNWATLIVARESDIDYFASRITSGTVVKLIRGTRGRNLQALFQEWAAALQFPYYFGHNWDAFDECINDLYWLPSKKYIFIITNVDSILQVDDKNFRIFLKLLKDAADTWAKPITGAEVNDPRWVRGPIAFQIVFHCESINRKGTIAKLKATGIEVAVKEIPPLDDID